MAFLCLKSSSREFQEEARKWCPEAARERVLTKYRQLLQDQEALLGHVGRPYVMGEARREQSRAWMEAYEPPGQQPVVPDVVMGGTPASTPEGNGGADETADDVGMDGDPQTPLGG